MSNTSKVKGATVCQSIGRVHIFPLPTDAYITEACTLQCMASATLATVSQPIDCCQSILLGVNNLLEQLRLTGKLDFFIASLTPNRLCHYATQIGSTVGKISNFN